MNRKWIYALLLLVTFTLLIDTLFYFNEQKEKFFGTRSVFFQRHNELASNKEEREKRFVVFCGTRPEIIKVAPVVIQLKKAGFNTKVVFTGQHPDIILPFQKFFDIHFDAIISNDVFIPGQSLESLTSRLIAAIGKRIKKNPFDVWIVQGDTSSAFAAGTVAFFRKYPVIHLEAGLRTFHMQSPFPEEFHRRSMAFIASIHISPTKLASKRLIAQGVDPSRIFTMGNSGIDATRIAASQAAPNEELQAILGDLVLVTFHRRENADKMKDYFNAIGESSCHHTFIVPVHPNPIATEAANGACQKFNNIQCVSPLGYREIQWILSKASFVITDSGGLQEESTWYSKPVLVARETTERSEAIETGSSLLVPSADDLSEKMAELCKADSKLLRSMQVQSFPFGYGNTSIALANFLHTQEAFNLLNMTISPLRMVDINKQNEKNEQISEGNCGQASPSWEDCTRNDMSIDVVLTLYERPLSLLKDQLNQLKDQTLLPTRVIIVQNSKNEYDDDDDDLDNIVNFYNAPFQIEIVQSSANTKFHFRFHAAYVLSNADYVAIIDDDQILGYNWLNYCVQYSKAHNGALVGGNGRNFERFNSQIMKVDQEGTKGQGLVDFVGHSWVLKREYLRLFLGFKQYTYFTGEDMQLSFALQSHGIASHSPPHNNADGSFLDESSFGWDKHTASYLTMAQEPRNWLECKIIREGFQPLSCDDCTMENMDRCLKKYSSKDKKT